ncbi:MAG: hypothetical protein ACRDRK_03935 [Pseudonocardia sp.]
MTRFDCQDRADWLTPKRLAAFLAGIRYCGSTTPEVMHARIAAAPAGATGDPGAAAVHVTRVLMAALQALIAQIDVLTDQITEQLHAYADGHIFRSLPRGQALLAGRRRLRPRPSRRCPAPGQRPPVSCVTDRKSAWRCAGAPSRKRIVHRAVGDVPHGAARATCRCPPGIRNPVDRGLRREHVEIPALAPSSIESASQP